MEGGTAAPLPIERMLIHTLGAERIDIHPFDGVWVGLRFGWGWL